MATADLISRARAGNGEAFRELSEPYRRELQVHCYRMLGSFQDAEDALQDTLLAAWQGLDGFEGRASIRTWLYRIATNRCLNARRSGSRRPAKEWDIPGVEPPEPTRLGEIVWLEPFPDGLLEGGIGMPLGPEARYEQTESISLAFVTALQALPPRQLAVVILRDVLGFHANEVAEMLDASVDSVNSALKRARDGLRRRRRPAGDREPPPDRGSPSEDAIVARFVSAWESADLDALVALLTDDVFVSMPPMPFEYEGRDVVARFCAGIFGASRRFALVPTRANGQPAFGAYLRAPSGTHHGIGLFVLTLTGDRICAMTRFENTVLPSFGLPRSLTSPKALDAQPPAAALGAHSTAEGAASMPQLQTLITGLAFGESPRWHDGRLWCCDWIAHEIVAVDLDGESEVITHVRSLPFCIDWLPGGPLVITSGRAVLRLEPDGSQVSHADLSALTEHGLNEIVVDGRGNAFVNSAGFDLMAGDEFAPGIVVVVTPDGSARQVADGLAFPNGMAVTPDNSTLIVAESYGKRLTAFEIDADGSLSNRRVWADLRDGVPDGICLDEEGAVWYGDVPNRRCVRVREGGEVMETIDLDHGCFACMLGGPDGRTLFMVSQQWGGPASMGQGPRTGRILAARAPVPRAGRP